MNLLLTYLLILILLFLAFIVYTVITEFLLDKIDNPYRSYLAIFFRITPLILMFYLFFKR